MNFYLKHTIFTPEKWKVWITILTCSGHYELFSKIIHFTFRINPYRIDTRTKCHRTKFHTEKMSQTKSNRKDSHMVKMASEKLLQVHSRGKNYGEIKLICCLMGGWNIYDGLVGR